MAYFFDLTTATPLANPFLAALQYSTVFKRDARIYYALEYDSSTRWTTGGTDKAFRSAINAWKAITNLDLREWPFPLAPGDESGATWVERLAFENVDNPELGRHSLPNTDQMIGVYNKQHPLWSAENNAVGGRNFVTFLHEIGHGLGLLHPHDNGLFPGVTNPEDFGQGLLNQSIFTVMSYNDGYNLIGYSPSNAYGWQATPGALDIAVIQATYGANMTTAAGDNLYKIPGVNAAGTYFACIWDAGGTDTISAEGIATGCTIDLRAATLDATGSPGAGGWLSRADTIYGGFTIANGVTIENAIGGDGNDHITGNDTPNRLQGDAGDDQIEGGSGADTLDGGSGADVLNGNAGADFLFGGDGDDRIVLALDGDTIDGGAGADTVLIGGYAGWFQVDREADGFRITSSKAPGSAFVKGLEHVEANGANLSFDDFRTFNFDFLRYNASYHDLIAAFGTNADLGKQHYLDFGELEGRKITFDPLRYMAGYADLIAAFGGGTVVDGIYSRGKEVTEHYILFGAAEGRQADKFDALQYAAANPERLQVFGTDATVLTQDYLGYGFRNGLQTEFDGLRYIASYGDLIRAFGTDAHLGVLHYVQQGFAEHRFADGFHALSYTASYADLISAYGIDETAATEHYIRFGFAEGRTASFDALRYIGSYADLIRAYGTDERAATSHFIQFGYGEHRQVTFDPVAYLLTYQDLGQHGLDAAGALRHWITNGYSEGRTGNGVFGAEQQNHALGLDSTVTAAIEQASDRDWFELNLRSGESVRFSLETDGSGGALQNGRLQLYDSRGQLLAWDDGLDANDAARIDFAAETDDHYYLAAASALSGGIGSYMIVADVVMGGA